MSISVLNLPHPMIRNTYHLLLSAENTITNSKNRRIPSHNIQEKTAR